MAKVVPVWKVMRLTSPSYRLDLKIHLCLSLRKDQGKDLQSQTKLSLNQKNETKRDWSDEEVRELITLWKEEEVLYNSKYEKYYNKDEKQKAWKRIAGKLISRGFSEIEDAQISDKITSQRSYDGINNWKKKRQKLVVPEALMSM